MDRKIKKTYNFVGNSIKIRNVAMALFLAVVVTFAGVGTVHSQPPNPPPDCPGTPFIGPVTRQVPHPNGCLIVYTFWYRYACNIWYDTYIERFEVIGNNCGDFDAQYEEFVDVIKADIVGRVNPWQWITNPPVPSPNIPMCGQNQWSPTQWRFFRPSCHSEEIVTYWDETGNLVRTRIPCQDPARLGYCYQTYRYCWREVNGRLVLQSQVMGRGAFGSINCPPIVIFHVPGEQGPRRFICMPWSCGPTSIIPN